MKAYKGKRSTVYRIFNIGMKVELKESKALCRIENEGKWLKKLNKYGIGPKLYFSGKKFVVFEFFNGKRILNWKIENEFMIVVYNNNNPQNQVRFDAKKIFSSIGIDPTLLQELKSELVGRTIVKWDFVDEFIIYSYR